MMTYSSWDMVRDKRTGEQKKWHIEMDAPPKIPQYCKLANKNFLPHNEKFS